MDEQNRNLLIATGLSFVVILVWTIFFPPEQPEPDLSAPTEIATTSNGDAIATTPSSATNDDASAPTQSAEISDAPRLPIETTSLSGSISLEGGRIDDLFLSGYNVNLGDESEKVRLLSPVGDANAYYALYGWAPASGGTGELPGPNTLWSVKSGDKLTTDNALVLEWDNGAGLVFTREVTVDDKFMFNVTQTVTNNTGAEIKLAPYATIARHGEPDVVGFFILHEGVVRMSDGNLQELNYDDMPDLDIDPTRGTAAEAINIAENGWVGFTDKYWMTNIIPTQGQAFRSTVLYQPKSEIYQAEALLPTQTVAAGATASVSSQLFAGAKEWDTIRTYQNDGGIDGFLDSIDWGWFFFLTKPIFAVLHWLNSIIGNMGWAIIALTLLIKALLLPLAYKSYVSMAKMKDLQPQMQALKEEAGEDRQKMQKGMMELYKKHKVNPAAGCLPILLQIPIFFSLYKVIFVTLELRHAPWLGWIKDLSAPDPSSILNLFGLLPWGTPEVGSIFAIVSLGVLPILLGISMWLQQKLNPAPTDPTQQMIFAWMPWVFMFMLGSFASGLVLYWIANNTITFIQQYLIMRSQGMKPDVFGNIRESFQRKPKEDAK